MLELYQRISLTQYFPEYHLKKGDIDTAPHPEGGERSFETVYSKFNIISNH